MAGRAGQHSGTAWHCVAYSIRTARTPSAGFRRSRWLRRNVCCAAMYGSCAAGTSGQTLSQHVPSAHRAIALYPTPLTRTTPDIVTAIQPPYRRLTLWLVV